MCRIGTRTVLKVILIKSNDITIIYTSEGNEKFQEMRNEKKVNKLYVTPHLYHRFRRHFGLETGVI